MGVARQIDIMVYLKILENQQSRREEGRCLNEEAYIKGRNALADRCKEFGRVQELLMQDRLVEAIVEYTETAIGDIWG